MEPLCEAVQGESSGRSINDGKLSFQKGAGEKGSHGSSAGLLALITVGTSLVHPVRTRGDDRLEYRYEDYSEDDGRMQIRTHAAGFEKELLSKITARGQFVYDTISGATPTGEMAPIGSDEIPLAEVHDIRRAGSLEASVRYDQHTTTPQFSYSDESDYRSLGLALNHTMDFNQRNTTLVAGIAHNFDEVGGGVLDDFEQKDTTDFLLGVNQLLGPHTVFSANLTFGYADGYLNDPYRRVTFFLPDSPDSIFSDPGLVNPVSEHRPEHRFRQVLYASVTHGFESLHASMEGSARLHHDDWGIWSETAALTWFQKLGKRLTLSPTLRFYHQSEADFYAPGFVGLSFSEYTQGTRVAFEDGVFLGFEGDAAFPAPADEGNYRILPVPARPTYYSSDYRLSEFNTITLGVGAHIQVCDHFTIDLAYKRYIMRGLDGVTDQAVYPDANVFTVGCGLWF